MPDVTSVLHSIMHLQYEHLVGVPTVSRYNVNMRRELRALHALTSVEDLVYLNHINTFNQYRLNFFSFKLIVIHILSLLRP